MLLNNRNGKLYLDDEPFYLCSGDLHYFRVHPSQWDARLDLMKDFGLNTVQTYCAWNLHEPKRGVFDFKGKEGLLDLGRFLDAIAAHGMKCLLRPAPFICSECDMGGLPAWLVIPKPDDPDQGHVVLRSLDPRYIEPLEEYYKELCKIILPRLSTNGGAVIAVAIDNEYGGVSHDIPYLEKVGEILRQNGVDVPLYTTDGKVARWLYTGTTSDCIMEGINYRAKPGEFAAAKQYHEKMNPTRPLFIGELWAGRAIYWDEPFSHRPPEETAEAFREALEGGAYVNFYMFSGGTNFGSFSGGVVGKSYTPRPDAQVRFICHTTSYDEDSPITEYGTPTEKYYQCREVLDKFLGKPVRPRPEKPYPYRAQYLGAIPMTEQAYLSDNLDALTTAKRSAVRPITLEEMGESYGFVLYETAVPSFGMELDSTFMLREVRDRATVYANGEYLGQYYRDREEKEIPYKMPLEGCKLSVLVENLTHQNTGFDLDFERKGILRDVRYQRTRIVNWTTRAIPLTDISALHYEPLTEIKPDQPVFLRGTFDAEAGVDTFILPLGFTHGHIWLNGFDLGRYWYTGPQRTLYCPGAIVKEKDNVLEIFDVNPTGTATSVSAIDRQILE